MFPSNPSDLMSCQQKLGESHRDYIQSFSRKCHELPRVDDTDVISVFWDGMMYHTLVHELDHEQSNTTKDLLDMHPARRRLGPPSSWAM
jgi:hypothetical protein